MKFYLFILSLAAVLMSNTLFACDIVEARKVHRGFSDGIEGVCSNNGGEIDCYYAGKYRGGITCSGPRGTYSGYNLQNLIYSVCGCSAQERDESLKNQLREQLE